MDIRRNEGLDFLVLSFSFARPGDRNPQGGHTRRLTLAAVPAAVLAAQSEELDRLRSATVGVSSAVGGASRQKRLTTAQSRRSGVRQLDGRLPRVNCWCSCVQCVQKKKAPRVFYLQRVVHPGALSGCFWGLPLGLPFYLAGADWP